MIRKLLCLAVVFVFLVPAARTQNFATLSETAVSTGPAASMRPPFVSRLCQPGNALSLARDPRPGRATPILVADNWVPNPSLEALGNVDFHEPRKRSPWLLPPDCQDASAAMKPASRGSVMAGPAGLDIWDTPEPDPEFPPRPLGEGEQRVQWNSLLRAELLFLATMHSYRIGTEEATRDALQNHIWGGYLQALGALHGWSDGDGYYETYLGHPIQGAVAGYMWIHNDPRYRVVEFGKSRDYWMSRLRAYAWSYVEIEQFKVGLLSEATLGQVSRYCCAYGFNDHVITSNGGLVWIVGEDAIDRYIVRKIEDHTRNVPLRILARVALNPPQGMANLMNLQYPWYREDRPAPSRYSGDLYLRPESRQDNNKSPMPFVPKFEATASLPSVMWFHGLSCVGGSGVISYRLSDFTQWSGEVGGCMLLGKGTGWSGDSLTFMAGPQWILHSESRWTPHFHVRAGGQKITEEYCQHYGPPQTGLHPGRLCEADPAANSTFPYAQHFETTGVAFSTGGGMDLRLTRAFTLRLADLDYVHTWVPSLNGTDFSQGLRFSMGLGLQVGTW